jgi:hypothetical protein
MMAPADAYPDDDPDGRCLRCLERLAGEQQTF